MLRINHISPFSFRPLILAGALLLLCLSSCSRVQSIREARTIVAEADSLRSAGQSLSPFTFHLSPSQSDSTTIASAVSALEPLRFFYPTAYAHANYYYGRLLREAGNQPEAMLAFLRVIHSRTKDHEIIARAYANIASMCRRAQEYPLSCQMDFFSARHFLANNDSIHYYYSLNNVAFDYAELNEKQKALALINYIESSCSEMAVLTNTLETKAEVYLKAFQNDSAIYYSEQLYLRGNHESTGLIIRAQAYDNLEIKDSALYYAKRVLESSNFYGDRFNALYILTNNDSTISTEEILRMTSDRTDIQMDYTEVRADLSHALQLLQQDLTRKPNLTWLWATLATLCIIATSISIYIRKKKAKHQLISQQTEQLLLKNEQLVQQTALLKQQHTLRREKMLQELEFARLSICNAHDWQKELHWKNYDEMCEILNAHFLLFADKLKATTALDEKEIRLCVLVFLDMFTLKQMAAILSYSETGIRTYKSRVNEKFGNKGHDLRNFLIENVILGTSDEQGM